jgi:hypothetical protein
MVQQLMQAGSFGETKKGFTPSLDQVNAAWHNALIGASYNQQYTPTQYLAFAASTGAFKAADGTVSPADAAYKGPVSVTNLTNQFDAKALVNNALGQYLGRAATDSEVAAFHAQLQASETANPSVRTPVGHNYVDSGGAGNGQQQAIDFAKSQSNYAETQAGSTGLSWLHDAVMSIGQDRTI